MKKSYQFMLLYFFMSSGLLIVAFRDVQSIESTRTLLNLAFHDDFKHLFISISDQHMNHSLLMKCLANIYDTSRDIHGQESSKVTVILYSSIGLIEPIPWNFVMYTKSVNLDQIPKSKSNILLQCLDIDTPLTAFDEEEGLPCDTFSISAVGGTFDHLHDGHRILLTISAFLTKDSQIIGITGPELLKNKSYAEFMEDFNKRKTNVENFLHFVKPNLRLNIHEINDVCGPTTQIKDIQGLILSKESLKGGEFVNNSRVEKNWSPLQLVIIDVIGGQDKNFKDKLSSTDYRRIQYERSTKS